MRKIFAVLFICLLAIPLAAQQRTGNLYGKVVDQDGIPLPGVNITLESSGGAPMTAQTNNEGVFRFLSLPPSSEYAVRCELDGFKTKVETGVIINIGRNTSIEVDMEMGAIEEEVTVIASTPIVTPKRTEVSHTIDRETMMALPSARDPWVMIQMVPSVMVDRENIGGSESGQQSSFVAKGEGTDVWIFDGINITDLSSQSSPGYYDFDIFEEISVTTGMPDVENRERAIVINMVTRRGQNKFGFGGRFFLTDEAFQMSPGGADYDAVKEVFSVENGYPDIAGYNHIKQIKDFGFNMGGPMVQDKVWWWMSYGVQLIETFVITGTADNTQLNNIAGKLNFQLLPDNRAEIFVHLGNKKKQGRNSSSSNPPGVNQHGKYHWGSPILKIQDEHMVGDDLFLSARYGFTDAGFGTWPGTDEEVTRARYYDQLNRIYKNPDGQFSYSYFYQQGRPHQFGLLQGIYYNDNLLGAAHEVKFGAEINNNQWDNISGSAGNFRLYWNYYTPQIDIDGDGNEDIPGSDWMQLRVYNNEYPKQSNGTNRYAFYLQDIISAGRLTFNLQARIDREIDYYDEYTTRSLYTEDVDEINSQNFYEIVNEHFSPLAITAITALQTDRTRPFLETPDDYRQWTFSPRVGATYDLFGDGKSIIKAAFAMYPGGPPGIGYFSPGGLTPQHRWWWQDDGDDMIEVNELYWADRDDDYSIYRTFDDAGNFIVSYDKARNAEGNYWSGYDWFDPLALTADNDTVDPDLKTGMDYDVLFSFEQELAKDVGIGLDVTYRWDANRWWELEWYPEFDSDGKITQFGIDAANGDFPQEFLNYKRNQDDYGLVGYVPDMVYGDSEGESDFSTGEAAGTPWYTLKSGPQRMSSKYDWLTNRPDRHNKYWGADLRWNKRYSNNWMLSGSFTYQMQKSYYGQGYLNPTSLWAFDKQMYTNSMGGGSGKTSVPMFSRWMFKLQGMYSLPFGFDVSFSVTGREGMLIDDYFYLRDNNLTFSSRDRGEYIELTTNENEARLGDIWIVNAKVQKRLVLGDTGSVWLSVDLFNAFNNQSMNRQRSAYYGEYRTHYSTPRFYPNSQFEEPNESLNPLILRVGVRFQF